MRKAKHAGRFLPLGVVAVLVALIVLLSAIRQPATTSTAVVEPTARAPAAHEELREPVRRAGSKVVTPPKRLQPPDMPPGPGLPEWSRAVD